MVLTLYLCELASFSNRRVTQGKFSEFESVEAENYFDWKDRLVFTLQPKPISILLPKLVLTLVPIDDGIEILHRGIEIRNEGTERRQTWRESRKESTNRRQKGKKEGPKSRKKGTDSRQGGTQSTGRQG